MKLLKKLKKKPAVIKMTPLETKPLIEPCHDYVPIVGSKHTAPKEVETVTKEYSAEVIKMFEETFPGKHAIWRGNYTKQFLAWAKRAYDT